MPGGKGLGERFPPIRSRVLSDRSGGPFKPDSLVESVPKFVNDHMRRNLNRKHHGGHSTIRRATNKVAVCAVSGLAISASIGGHIKGVQPGEHWINPTQELHARQVLSEPVHHVERTADGLRERTGWNARERHQPSRFRSAIRIGPRHVTPCSGVTTANACDGSSAEKPSIAAYSS